MWFCMRCVDWTLQCRLCDVVRVVWVAVCGVGCVMWCGLCMVQLLLSNILYTLFRQ